MAAASPSTLPCSPTVIATPPTRDLTALRFHTAVWDGDVDRLQALLLADPSGLEVVDINGNTPLLLAYRMGRTKMARMLLAAGAFPKPRTPEGYEAVQVAALTANTDLVREAVLAYLRETDAAFARRLPSLVSALRAMPDFTLRMSWEFSSWVPLISRMLPSDTFDIYKRGSCLRLDSTLLGMSGLKWQRGSISLLLLGEHATHPHSMFVMDNTDKTVADARLAFTHPRDQGIQDWVRKLLTNKHKATDFWSRDALFVPTMRKGLLGSIGSSLGRMAWGDSTPRGRVSEGSGSEGGTPAAASPVVHEEHPRLHKSDVAVWNDCAVYELRNLCVRERVHTRVTHSLKLADWWKPEYSREASASDVAAAAAGAAGAVEEAPERQLLPLVHALQAIRAGKINERNQASITMEELEGMGFDSPALLPDAPPGAPPPPPAGAGGSGGAPPTVSLVAFADYFGVERPKATAGVPAATPLVSSVAEDAAAGGGAGSSAAAAASATAPPPPPFVFTDGYCHKPRGAVAMHKEESTTVEDKVLDCKVYFSNEFPLTVESFLPVAEVMARTGRHAENVRRFFESKFPQGAGFPVKFTLPVLPTITATITFEHCNTRRSPDKSLFDIPADYTMGAYVEKGWIRQL